MHASHDSKEGGQRQSPRLQTEAWTVDSEELECEEKDDARLGCLTTTTHHQPVISAVSLSLSLLPIAPSSSPSRAIHRIRPFWTEPCSPLLAPQPRRRRRELDVWRDLQHQGSHNTVRGALRRLASSSKTHGGGTCLRSSLCERRRHSQQTVHGFANYVCAVLSSCTRRCNSSSV